MVDFNNDTTIATPSVQVNAIVILEARKYFIDAYGAYKKLQCAGMVVDSSVLQSRLEELFLVVRATMKRHLKNKPAWEELQQYIASNNITDVLEAFIIIDEWLDEIGLTKVDTKKKLGGNIVDRNKEQGWNA